MSDADRAVWAVVRRVPRGRVATYGEIAAEAGCTARQAGSALRRSPPGLRLPWHRIVRACGYIALPGEAGAEQRLRLQAEGVTFSGRRARIELHGWKKQP